MKQSIKLIPWFFIVLIAFILTIPLFYQSISQTYAADVTMKVYQQQGNVVFGNDTQLNIFDQRIIVDKKVIAPGNQDTYIFAVANTANSKELPYHIELISENEDEIPLVFWLQKNSSDVYGSLDERLLINTVKLPEYFLGGKKTDWYSLHWQWKFEDGQDIHDSWLGEGGVSTYKLIIRVTGTIPDSPATGDNTPIATVVVVGIVALVVALFALLFRKKRK